MRFSRSVWGLLGLVLVLMHGSSVFAEVSTDGLLIEYRYETSNGVLVQDGASAAGQVDDSGLAPQIHAIGSSGGEVAGLYYDTNVPDGIGSSFSLSFPLPESSANYVQIPMVEGDDLSSITVEDFRVETWFRTTDAGRSNLVSSYSGSATALNLELHTSNRGRIYVQGSSGTTDLNLTLPTDSRDGEWHHLAGVREGDLVELYYDGELVGDMFDVAGSYIINKTDFYLGMDGRPSGTPRFAGNLDDVRIFASADMSSVVAEYLFETIEGTPVSAGLSAGDQVDDTANVGPFHGLGSAATGASTPTYVADVPDVLSSSSRFSFAVDEQASSVEDAGITMVPELAEITLGDFAVETWFKTTDTGRSILLGGYDGAGDTVNLELHTDNRVRIYVDGPAVTDLNPTAPVDTRDDEWHHLLGQREEDVVSLYLDGELVDSTFDVAGPYTMTVNSMYLTRDSRTGGIQFDGQLDNTRFWARALSESEISELAAGVVPNLGVAGDYDGDGLLTAIDLNMQAVVIDGGPGGPEYDLNNDGLVNYDDRLVWVNDLKRTWIGDANLDGEFNSGDMVQVFAQGKYETGGLAGWEEGDWNADLEFGSGDMVAAFVAGGYEQGKPPVAAATAVPEPSAALLLAIAVLCLMQSGRQRRR